MPTRRLGDENEMRGKKGDGIMKKQKYLMNKHMKKQKYLKKQKYAGVEYDIYTCSDVCCPVPQWAVECRLCGFHIGTFTKREGEYWIRPHIEEEHADAVRGKKRRRDEMQENSNKDSEEGRQHGGNED